jgi:hypothetical protein
MVIRLDSLKITWPNDEAPDTSYLGEYTSNEPSSHDLHAGNAIRRHKAGWHEHKFWVPFNTADAHREGLAKRGYSRGMADYLARKYVREDYRRHEALCRGDWGFLGCVAKATVSYPTAHGRRLQTFSSGGLWGIETDSASSHQDEIAREELADLKSHLEAFGVDLATWDSLEAQAFAKMDKAA